jgi:hypothetical protein
MPYPKGVSGNDKGRPKGARNKKSLHLRSAIVLFLENNFEKVVEDFEQLKPHERLKFYTDLLQYGVPKLQATSLDVDIEGMTDKELDYIIEGLQKNIV